MILDKFSPVYDFNEVHTNVIQASPRCIFEAIHQLTPADIQLLRPLVEIRTLPARLMGQEESWLVDSRPLLEQMLKDDFVSLATEPDQEFVFGMIGQPWKIFGAESVKISNASEFLAFDQPNYAKIVANFYLEPEAATPGYRVRTETRIYVPDPAARKKFALYWRIIYPGSAIIRRMWLKAIKQRAEFVN